MIPLDPLPPGPDAAADEAAPILPAARAAWLLLWLLAGFVAATAASLALPIDRSIAWQQAEGTAMFHARWIYERLYHDRAPIEVAVLGSSRFEAGISPQVLAGDLSQRLGRPVPVANLSIVQPGRDFQLEVAKALFETHPEVKLLLLSDDGDIANSHPLFRTVADVRDVAAAPLLLNTKYFTNLFGLPWRNIANFAEAQAPAAFGLRARFDPAAYLGTGLDRTLGYRLADGTLVNGDQHMPARDLTIYSRDAVARQIAGLAPYRRLPRDWSMASDRVYVRRIAALARVRGVRIAFTALPLYGPIQSPAEPGFYRRFGPDFELPELTSDSRLYYNGAHLNRTGAIVASHLLAARLAPLLGGSVKDGRP